MKKLILALLCILIILNLTACGPTVLKPEEQLKIINDLTKDSDMTFEIMEEFPTEPLPALLIFDGDQQKKQKTEYSGNLIISSTGKDIYPNPKQYKYGYVCRASKMIILYGSYVEELYDDPKTLVCINEETDGIRLADMDFSEQIRIPMHNQVDHTKLEKDFWTIYLVRFKAISTWNSTMKARFHDELEFLLHK